MTARVITEPVPATMSDAEQAHLTRLLDNGWTVARHPWTGLVTNMPVNQAGFTEQLEGRGPDVARAFAAMHDGTGSVRWAELLDLDPDELLEWNRATGRNVTRAAVNAMKKAGLGPNDAQAWFTTFTLAAHMRMSNALSRYGENWYPKSNPQTRSESWHSFVVRHHRKGRSPQQMLGWAWDTPAWLLDALDGKAVKVTVPKLTERGFLVYAAALSDAPDAVRAVLANMIADLDEFRRAWVMQRVVAGDSWEAVACAMFRYDRVWSPGSEVERV